jgi:hypothetical protein
MFSFWTTAQKVEAKASTIESMFAESSKLQDGITMPTKNTIWGELTDTLA